MPNNDGIDFEPVAKQQTSQSAPQSSSDGISFSPIGKPLDTEPNPSVQQTDGLQPDKVQPPTIDDNTPIPLTGTPNASNLKVGKQYSENGNVYEWDGTKMNYKSALPKNLYNQDFAKMRTGNDVIDAQTAPLRTAIHIQNSLNQNYADFNNNFKQQLGLNDNSDANQKDVAYAVHGLNMLPTDEVKEHLLVNQYFDAKKSGDTSKVANLIGQIKDIDPEWQPLNALSNEDYKNKIKNAYQGALYNYEYLKSQSDNGFQIDDASRIFLQTMPFSNYLHPEASAAKEMDDKVRAAKTQLDVLSDAYLLGKDVPQNFKNRGAIDELSDKFSQATEATVKPFGSDYRANINYPKDLYSTLTALKIPVTPEEADIGKENWGDKTAKMAGGLLSIAPKFALSAGVTEGLSEASGLNGVISSLANTGSKLDRFTSTALSAIKDEATGQAAGIPLGSMTGFRFGGEYISPLFSKAFKGGLPKYLMSKVGEGVSATAGSQVGDAFTAFNNSFANNSKFQNELKKEGIGTLPDYLKNTLASLVSFSIFGAGKDEVDKIKKDAPPLVDALTKEGKTDLANEVTEKVANIDQTRENNEKVNKVNADKANIVSGDQIEPQEDKPKISDSIKKVGDLLNSKTKTDATKEGNITEDNQQQHQGAEKEPLRTETSGSDSIAPSGEEQAQSAKEGVTHEFTDAKGNVAKYQLEFGDDGKVLSATKIDEDGKPTDEVLTKGIKLNQIAKDYDAKQAEKEVPQSTQTVEPTEPKPEPNTGEVPVSETPKEEGQKTDTTPQTEQKYRIGKSPQTYTVIKEHPFNPETDQEGEKYVDVRNDKTGEIQQNIPFENLKGVKSKTDKILDALDKGKIDTKGSLHAFGVVPELWNAGIEIAKGIVKAGGTVADAIQKAIEHIKANLKPDEKFDEDKAKKQLEKRLGIVAKEKNIYDALKDAAKDYPKKSEFDSALKEQAADSYDDIKDLADQAHADVHGEVKSLPSYENAAQPVKDFLDTSRDVHYTGQLVDNVRAIKNSVELDAFEANKLLNKKNIPPELKNPDTFHRLLEYVDNERAGIIEDNNIKLTDKEKELLNNYIRPITEDNARMFEQITDKESQGSGHGIVSRFAKDKNNIIETIKNRAKSLAGGNLLSGNKSFLHTTAYKALTDENGNRQLVKITPAHFISEGGTRKKIPQQVHSIIDGATKKIGDFETFTKSELQQKRNEKIDNTIDYLTKKNDKDKAETEKLANKKGTTDEQIAEKVGKQKSVDDAIENLQTEKGKFDLSSFGDTKDSDRFFVDDEGKIHHLGEATTTEIESQTGTEYYKNPYTNAVLTNIGLRQVVRAQNFIEDFKGSDDFKNIAHIDDHTKPEGWKQTNLPQLKGWAFEPKSAQLLNELYKHGEADPLKYLSKANDFMVTTILLSPDRHPINEAVQWLHNRGLSGFIMPKSLYNLATTGGKALKEVASQGELYKDYYRNGAPLKLAGILSQGFDEKILNQYGEEVTNNPNLQSALAKAWGMTGGQLLNAWQKAIKVIAFGSHDMFALQAILEDEKKGYTRDEAIKRITRFIPTYDPIRGLGDGAVAKALTNKNIIAFGHYHFAKGGTWDSLINMGKDITSKKTTLESKSTTRAQALDKLLMVGAVSLMYNYVGDKVAQKITGNKNAHMVRAGAQSILYALQQVFEGRQSPIQAGLSQVTVAPATELGLESMSNTDFFTGKPITVGSEPLKQKAIDYGEYAMNKMPPTYIYNQVHEGKKSLKDVGEQELMAITQPKMSPTEVKLMQLKANRGLTESRIKKMAKEGNTGGAKETYQNFIDEYKKLQDEVEKEQHTK